MENKNQMNHTQCAHAQNDVFFSKNKAKYKNKSFLRTTKKNFLWSSFNFKLTLFLILDYIVKRCFLLLLCVEIFVFIVFIRLRKMYISLLRTETLVVCILLLVGATTLFANPMQPIKDDGVDAKETTVLKQIESIGVNQVRYSMQKKTLYTKRGVS